MEDMLRGLVPDSEGIHHPINKMIYLSMVNDFGRSHLASTQIMRALMDIPAQDAEISAKYSDVLNVTKDKDRIGRTTGQGSLLNSIYKRQPTFVGGDPSSWSPTHNPGPANKAMIPIFPFRPRMMPKKK